MPRVTTRVPLTPQEIAEGRQWYKVGQPGGMTEEGWQGQSQGQTKEFSYEDNGSMEGGGALKLDFGEDQSQQLGATQQTQRRMYPAQQPSPEVETLKHPTQSMGGSAWTSGGGSGQQQPTSAGQQQMTAPLQTQGSSWQFPTGEFRMFPFDSFSTSPGFRGELNKSHAEQLSPEQLQGNIQEAQKGMETRPTYAMKNESQRSQLEGQNFQPTTRHGRGSGLDHLSQRVRQVALAIQEPRYRTLFAKRVEGMIGGKRGRLY